MGNGFRQGIQATIPALRRYARALTRDAETADDLVQDPSVRTLRPDDFFNVVDYGIGLYAGLTNLNGNRLRSGARPPAYAPIDDDDVAGAPGADGGGRDI